MFFKYKILIFCCLAFSSFAHAQIAPDQKQFFDAINSSCIDDVQCALKASPFLINVVDEKGCTPLHFAAALGNAPMVQILLNAGANRSLKDMSGRTPLDWAWLLRNGAVVELFERHVPTLQELSAQRIVDLKLPYKKEPYLPKHLKQFIAQHELEVIYEKSYTKTIVMMMCGLVLFYLGLNALGMYSI